MLLNRLRKLKLNEDDEGNDLTTALDATEAAKYPALIITIKTMQGKIIDVSEAVKQQVIFITDTNEVGLLWKYENRLTDEFLKIGNISTAFSSRVTRDYANVKMNLFLQYPKIKDEFSNAFVEDTQEYGNLQTVETENAGSTLSIFGFRKLFYFDETGRKLAGKKSDGVISIKRGGYLNIRSPDRTNSLMGEFNNLKIQDNGFMISEVTKVNSETLKIQNIVGERTVVKNGRLYVLAGRTLFYYPLIVSQTIDEKEIKAIMLSPDSDIVGKKYDMERILEINHDHILMSLVESSAGRLMLYTTKLNGKNGRRYIIKTALRPPAASRLRRRF